MHVPKTDEGDLDQTILLPTVQIRDSFDIRSVLDFSTVRLGSACSSSRLTALPEFQNVSS